MKDLTKVKIREFVELTDGEMKHVVAGSGSDTTTTTTTSGTGNDNSACGSKEGQVCNTANGIPTGYHWRTTSCGCQCVKP